MKVLVFALTLCAGVLAHADCQVQSTRYPELQTGINAETICRETVAALEGSFGVKAADYDVVVVANGARSTYQVQLEVLLQQDNKTQYRAEGTMHWYPGEAYVQFKK